MFWSKRKPQVQDNLTSGDSENPMYSGTGYKEMDDSLLGTAPSSSAKDKQKKQIGAAAAAFLAALLITWAILSYAWLPGHVQDAMNDATIQAASVTMYEPIVINNVINNYGDDSSGEHNNNNQVTDDDSSWRRRMAQRNNAEDDSSYVPVSNVNTNPAVYYDDSSSTPQQQQPVNTDDDSSWGGSQPSNNNGNYDNVEENVWAILPMDANIQISTGQLGKSTVQDLTANVYFCFDNNSTLYNKNSNCEVGDAATLMGTISLSDIDILPGGKATSNYLNPQMYITNAMVFKQFAASILVDTMVTVQLIGTATVKSRVAGIWSHSVKNVDIDVPMYFEGIGGLANSFSPTLDFSFHGNYASPSMIMSSFMQNPSTTSIAEMGSVRMEMWGPEGFAENSAIYAGGYVGAVFSQVVLMGNSSITETFEVTETVYNDDSNSMGTYQTIEVAYENVTQNSYTNGWNNFASVGPVTIKERDGEGKTDLTDENWMLSYDSLDYLVSNYLNGVETNMVGEIKSGNGASASTSAVWSYVLSGAKIPYTVTPAGKTRLVTLINCENMDELVQEEDKEAEDKDEHKEGHCMITLHNPFGVALTGFEMELTVYFGGVAVATIKAHDDQVIVPKYGYNKMEAKLEVIQYGGDDYEATMYNTWVTAVSIAGGTDSMVMGEIIVDQMATVNGLYLSYGPQTVTITTYKA